MVRDRRRIYLDWNAGAPLLPTAREAMIAALANVGNASSVHAEGRQMRGLIEAARADVAHLVGVGASSVIFTSGGTEANMTALTPLMEDDSQPIRFSRLLISAIEHPSVLAGGRFAPEAVTQLPVDPTGRVDLSILAEQLETAMAMGERVLVSVMAANNETGIVQPIAEVAQIAHDAGAFLHVDAVQAVGRLPIDAATLGADLLSLSGHKIGAPRGTGAVIVARPGLRIQPLLTGGGQEGRARAGTENGPAIAGLGAAARSAADNLDKQSTIAALRDWLEAQLCLICQSVVIFGDHAPRLANTSAFAIPGVSAEALVMALDLDGVAVSSGAACSSGKVAASHVLDAMGVPEDLAAGAIRVSLGPATKEAEIDAFLKVWRTFFTRLAAKRVKAA